MKKKVVIVGILFMMVFVLWGCNNVDDSKTVTVVDMVGDTVEVPKSPQKVAVIARAAADMMIGFGLADSVDGIYYSVLDNPWVEFIYPNIDDFYSYDYNESAELFLSREVDLILAPEQYIAEGLRDSGLNAITVSLYGNPNYDDYMFYLADLINQIWPETDNIVNQWKTELNFTLDEITNGLDSEEIDTRSIYYVRGDKDRGIGYTDTGGSLLQTVYETYFKMEYIGSSFESNKPSAEEIMLRNPDVIVIGGKFQNKLIDDINTLEPYRLLSAVTQNQVHNIPIGFVMWEQNSVVLPIFISDQANKLYPDLFDYDISDLTKTSFETYFNITLTDEQISYMLNGLSPNGSQMYN